MELFASAYKYDNSLSRLAKLSLSLAQLNPSLFFSLNFVPMEVFRFVPFQLNILGYLFTFSIQKVFNASYISLRSLIHVLKNQNLCFFTISFNLFLWSGFIFSFYSQSSFPRNLRYDTSCRVTLDQPNFFLK